ncbi:hypothetical protein EMCRGX_G014963 [Ephydatia muelleri]
MHRSCGWITSPSGDVIHPQLRCIGSGHETRTQRVIISYQNDDNLASKALAVALTRAYRSDTAEDLGQAVRVAIRVASLSRHLLASSPQQPYVSTVKGIQTQPERLHFSSLVSQEILSLGNIVAATIFPKEIVSL